MRKKLKFLLLFFIVFSFQGFSQKDTSSFDVVKRSIRYPRYYPEWKIRTALGFSMVSPPRDLLENAMQAPLVDFKAVMGLPLNFSLEGNINTIIVSNQITLGPRYNVVIKKFAANIGFDVGYMYGSLHQGGFDNTANLWTFYPNISAGYRFGNILLTVRGDISYFLHTSSKTGENEIDHKKNFYNGGSLGIYVEQRLWKNKVLVVGFKDNYLKYYWPTWMLFSTFDRYYHIPEISFSWIL